MKTYIFIIITIFSHLFLHAQSIEWEKSYVETNIQVFGSLQQTSDDGYIFGGTTKSDDDATTDYWILKTDDIGEFLWEKRFGGSNIESLTSVRQTNDDGYIIGGTSNSSDGDIGENYGKNDFWIVKTDALGELEWEKSFGGPDEDFFGSIIQTNDGGYMVGGRTGTYDGDVESSYGNFDFLIIKTTESGEIEWEKSFEGANYDALEVVQQTNDGGYILGGQTYINDSDVGPNFGQFDFWIVKTNESGEIEWEKKLGGSKSEFLSAIQQTNDGGFILGGSSSSKDGDVSSNSGFSDFWIAKLDNIGNLEWEKNFGGSSSEFLNSIEQTSDGGYLICGDAFSSNGDVTTNSGFFDYWVIKTDNQGNLVWEKTFGGALPDKDAKAQQTSDDGFIVAGKNTRSSGDFHLLIFKLEASPEDCAGIYNGPNTIDECGVCDDNPNNDNSTCTDCLGIVNGTNTIDECGVCDDDTNNDNITCTDCLGIVNGTNTIDECGVCDDNPNNDDSTCTDCLGIVNGTNTIDECGVCDDDTSNDNLTCTGFAIISSNTPDLDFGKVELMDVASMSLNIQNPGEQPLSVSKFTFDDPAFYAEINEISLDELSETTVTIYFNPNEIKNYESELVLESNAGELNVNLFGEGVLETSINEILNTNLTIFPNPSNGIFTINLGGLETTITEVKVYDIAGRCILNKPFNLQNKINLTAKAAGIYYLYLQTNNGIIVEKIIKK